MNKKILQSIQYGMYLVTTKDQQNNYGCIMNTLTQVTSTNPKICFHLNKENETAKQLLKTKKAAISILSVKVDPNIISIFGFQSSKNVDKFKNIPYQLIDNLPVYQENVVGYLIGDVVETVEMDTHITFFVSIEKMEILNDFEPMSYAYYHQVLKGKAPKKASTYIEEEQDEDTYTCDVCGYQVKGTIPDDFICPICGMPRSHFRKQN